jgi:hypothetical protein
MGQLLPSQTAPKPVGLLRLSVSLSLCCTFVSAAVPRAFLNWQTTSMDDCLIWGFCLFFLFFSFLVTQNETTLAL